MSRLKLIPAVIGLAALALPAILDAQTPPPAVGSAIPAAPASQAPAANFSPPPTGGNLNITPKRLVFDRNRRSGTVYIYNQGDTATAFDITLVDRVMMPDGRIIPLTEAQAKPDTKAVADQLKSAKTILLASPRRVTLGARQGQTIRVRLINPDTPLTDGEYRSHLTVIAIPPRDSGTSADDVNAGSNQLNFRINALFGFSIPVIARVGDTDARASIENVKVELVPPPKGAPAGTRPSPTLSFDLVRLGTSSVYGNVDVRIAGARRGDPIGVLKGVGLYPELARRQVHVFLDRMPSPTEKLEVTLTDDDSAPGKVLAKVTP